MADAGEPTTNLRFRRGESASSSTSIQVKGTPGTLAAMVNEATRKGQKFIAFETSASKGFAIQLDRIVDIADD